MAAGYESGRSSAGLASPCWSCSYEDALGRTICETRPGFRGALLIASNEYNTANQLVATRSYAIEQSNNSGGLRLIESFLVCGEAPVNLVLMVFLGFVEISFQSS